MTVPSLPMHKEERRQHRLLTARHAGKYRAADPRWHWPAGSIVFGYAADEAVVQTLDDRLVGTLVTGQSGGGKSSFTENVFRQDFLELDGFARGALLIDPHGTLIAKFLRWYVSHELWRVRPVRVLRASDLARIFHLHPLRQRPGVDPAVTGGACANALMKGVGHGDPNAMWQLRETSKCTCTALVELGLPITEASNLLDLTDATGLRAYAVRTIKNPIARQFLRTLDALPFRERDAKVGSAMRRLTEFLLPERARLIFSNPETAIDWRQIMDDGEFVVLDLSYDQGSLSEDESQVIGAMVLADIFLSCLGRPETSNPFFVYIDECHRFLTEDIAKLFTQGRKFRCSPILIHQTLGDLRDAGDRIFSLVMQAATRVMFRIAEDDDALYLARSAFRSQFDLQRDKEKFRKPTVVDYTLDWLLNESEGRGTGVAAGTTSTYGGSQSASWSTTKNKSTTHSESDTVSESTTLSESDTVSESVTTSESDTASDAHTDSSSGSTSYSESESTSTGASSNDGYSERYEPGDLLPREYSQSRGEGNSSTRSSGSARGTSSAYGSADTSGSAHTTGRAHTTGTAHTQGIARTTGTAHTTGTAITEGTAETQGTTTGTNWSRGTTATTTVSQQHTQGRAQSLRPVLKDMPGIPYSLEELTHLAAVRLGELQQGHCVAKIGLAPAMPLAVVRVKSGWARPEHVERVIEQLSAETPYVLPVKEAIAAQRERRRSLTIEIASTPTAAMLSEEEFVSSPPLKDEGWG